MSPKPAMTLTQLQRRAARAPRDAKAAYALGVAWAAREAPVHARECLGRAVMLDPRHAEAHAALARTLADRGDAESAVREYAAALALEPSRAEWYTASGVLYARTLRRAREATELFVRAMRCPGAPMSASVELAHLAIRHATVAEALRSLAALLPEREASARWHHALATALHEVGRHDEAIDLCTRVLDITPDDRLALIARASARSARREFDAALADYRAAAAHHPADEIANLELIVHLFRLGRVEQAQTHFRALVRHRVRTYEDGSTSWDGSPGRGRTLRIVQWNMGYGDVVQFSRFAALAADLDWRVVVECQPAVWDLVRSIPGVTLALRPYDPCPVVHSRTAAAHVGLLAADRSRWAADGAPYVRVRRSLIRQWREKVSRDRGCLRVGVMWGTPYAFLCDPHRDKGVPLEALRPLATVPRVRLYALKAAPEAQDLATTPLPVADLRLPIRDFPHTAAAMMSLDLIISPDTSVAHVAGALGRPCWIMLPYVSDWRWGTDQTTTAWYASVRLFRQSRPGRWDDVVSAMRQELLTVSGVS